MAQQPVHCCTGCLSLLEGAASMPDLAVCLSFDFDTMSANIFRGQTTPTWLSRGEYGARVGLGRILELLDEYGIRATFFVPGYTADSFPEHVRRICAAGHEIGNHGYLHEPPAQAGGDAEVERGILRKGSEALHRATGVTPVGYRSPSWDLSEHSVRLLREEGFLYDSSLMADDFRPYLCREGDQLNPESGYVMGAETEVVELPVSWILDDFPYFELRPQNSIMAAPSHVYEIWQGEFNYAYERVPGGQYVLTMHPQVIGRGHRIRMLEKLVRHMRSRPGIRFATMQEIAVEAKPALLAARASSGRQPS
jgi:peptidoglycan/xylan/chitin deacetylase (PgdA/CDA1 family)